MGSVAALPFPSPTRTYHTTTYPAISPTLPTLSQANKNILITGAGQGIGRAIALSFAAARPSKLGLISRTLPNLEETKSLIEQAHPGTRVFIYQADTSDFDSLSSVVSDFAREAGGKIHTLVANAGVQPGISPVVGIAEADLRKSFDINVLGNVNSIKAFHAHMPTSPTSATDSKYKATIIHISTAAAQMAIPMVATYASAKLMGTQIFEAYAIENPDVRVINVHPGIIDTAMNQAAKEGGIDFQPKDDISLPADFALWAASGVAEFLGSGRLIWAHWDVDELREIFEGFEEMGGKVKDGIEALGMTVNKKFTLGLLGWP